MLGRWPTLKELSLKVGIPLDQVRSTMGHTGTRVFSLEKMLGDPTEGSRPWEMADPDEFPDPAQVVDRKAALQLLGSALSSLSNRDKEIVQMRYFKAMPFHEIGKTMNLSESRVCQLHKRILNSLNKRLKNDMEAAA